MLWEFHFFSLRILSWLMAQASACASKRTFKLMVNGCGFFIFIKYKNHKGRVQNIPNSFKGTSGRLRHEQLLRQKG